MKIPIFRSAGLFCLPLILAFLALGSTARPATPNQLAPVLEPFVENKLIAGAVVLVADANKVLDIETIGWMNIAAKRRCARTACFGSPR